MGFCPSRSTQITAAPSIRLFDRRVTVSSQFDYRGGFVQANVNEFNRCSTAIANCRAANDPAAPLEHQARRIAGIDPRFGATRWGYQEDASFTRWREFSVTAVLPTRFAAGLRASSASVSVGGRNLALFTRYSGYDPEVNQQAGFPPPFAGAAYEGFGADNPTAPQSRYWILRLNLGF